MPLGGYCAFWHSRVGNFVPSRPINGLSIHEHESLARTTSGSPIAEQQFRTNPPLETGLGYYLHRDRVAGSHPGHGGDLRADQTWVQGAHSVSPGADWPSWPAFHMLQVPDDGDGCGYVRPRGPLRPAHRLRSTHGENGFAWGLEGRAIWAT